MPTRGLMGRPRDMIQEALDTMGFFECPNLCRGLLREYRFLPWSLRRDWCDASVGHDVFRDEQGRSFGQCPGPDPMPDGPTRSCHPLDTEYETGPVKGRKRKVEVGNPKELLKQARREESKKGKGKGKKKAALGPSEKVVESRVAQHPLSVTFIGEDITAEEARLIDAAIASSLATSRAESMLRTQSAGTGPSNLGERFEGTREPRLARPFTGFSPTVNLESQVLYTGKFRLGTMLVGGPLPPLVLDDDKEEMGEVEGAPVSALDDAVPAPVLDASVLDQADLFHMEEDPWDDMDLEMNPWADS